ncbi:PP2C family protein-serine/threonine phosphatase [Kocuria sp. U4B]
MLFDVVDAAETARLQALHALDVLDTPREERFDRIVRLAQEVFGVDAAAVNLIAADRQFTKAEVGLDGAGNCAREDSFCTHTIRQPQALVVEDALRDERFWDDPFVTGDPHIRFYAGYPLHAAGGHRVGTLCLIDPAPRAWDAGQERILAQMAGWAEAELVRAAELDRAAQVQQVLMPTTTPDLPGWEAAGRCVPTQAIGGDFYTWHGLPDGKLQVHVADVMGKGIPAALIAASMRATLVGAAQFNDQQQTIQRTAAATQQLLEDTGAFVTAFSARLDPATGVLEYVDAGHGLAFVLGEDGYRGLEHSGPPLGIFSDTTWQTHRTTLAPGETLVVVSDGFLDFFPTLEETLERARQARLHRLPVAELVERATAFARATGHPDDVTVVAVRRCQPT